MTTPLRTTEQARQWMDEQGLSQAELARRFGVTSSLVDAILRGAKPCKRGASHNIAVYLGLKRGQAVAAKQPYRTRAVQAAVAGASA
ncbi:MAG: helix-turn-helix domain-containing protein [Burkholderiaceae bacterium]|nr:helix-turn-helix domain-containing protein [Burkholderiaceae bacterium]